MAFCSFSKDLLAILGFLYFYTNFRISLIFPTNSLAGVLIWISIYLQTNYVRIGILIVMNLVIDKYGIF